MDRNKLSAWAYLADIDMDPVNDGGGTPTVQPTPSSPGVLGEDIPTSFAALSITSFVPTTSTSPFNSNVYFDVYIVFASLVQSGFLPPKQATMNRNQSMTNPDIVGTKLDHLGPVFCSPWNWFRPVQTGFFV